MTTSIFPGTNYRPYPLRWLIVALIALLCLTFLPYLFAGKTFLPSDLFDTMTAPFNGEYHNPQSQNHYFLDGLAQTYPYKIETQEALKRGKLAYWNPHILAGYPEYAETMANNFDVFNILLFWLNAVDAIHWETVLELLIAGIGMLFLLRFFGVHQLINLLFSSAYMLNSMFISTAANRWIIASFCWVPFVVLMILRYFNTGDNKNIIYSSIFLAFCFFGGTLQTAFYALLIVGGVLLLYPDRTNENKFFRRVGLFVLIGAVSFGLSAIMWLPTLELFFRTITGGGSLNSSSIYSEYTILHRILSIPFLATLAFPTLSGDAQIFNLKKIANLDPMNFNGAISFLPFLFAIWGCFILWKNKSIRPFIVLGISAILLPIATPLYYYLYHRIFIVASFALSIIGAVAFQSLLSNQELRNSFKRFFRWTKFLFIGMVVVLFGVAVYINLNYEMLLRKYSNILIPKIQESAFGAGNESWMMERISKTLDYYSTPSLALWLPIVLGIVSLLTLTYFLRGKLAEKKAIPIILLLTIVDLFTFSRIWLPTIDQGKFPIYPQNPISNFLRSDSSDSRFIVWRDASKDPFILIRNSSNVYKINDIHGYESLTSRSFITFYLKNVGYDSLDLHLLGLVNVKYIVAGKKELPSPFLRPVYSADGVKIYENLLSKPRAYIAYKCKILNTENEIKDELLQNNFDGTTAIFTKGDAPLDTSLGQAGSNSVRISTNENEKVEILAESSTKGLLIITDSYYPGWKCYVNGEETPIYRVNYCMRGVPINSGKSTITFIFEPDIYTAGYSISAITFLLSISGIFLIRRKQKNRRTLL